jgi:hypothetical protein
MTTATMAEGASCKPNISASGRRMRTRFGYTWIAIGVVVLVVLIGLRAAWYWRALLLIPAGLAAIGLLQARRNTCVARAAEGTFEHEDLSKTKAPDADVAASRLVSAAIRRDTLLIALGCGVLAAATALVH